MKSGINIKRLLTSLVAMKIPKSFLAEQLECDPKTVTNIISSDDYMTEAEAVNKLGISIKTFRSLVADKVLSMGDILNGNRAWKQSEIDSIFLKGAVA